MLDKRNEKMPIDPMMLILGIIYNFPKILLVLLYGIIIFIIFQSILFLTSFLFFTDGKSWLDFTCSFPAIPFVFDQCNIAERIRYNANWVNLSVNFLVSIYFLKMLLAINKDILDWKGIHYVREGIKSDSVENFEAAIFVMFCAVFSSLHFGLVVLNISELTNIIEIPKSLKELSYSQAIFSWSIVGLDMIFQPLLLSIPRDLGLQSETIKPASLFGSFVLIIYRLTIELVIVKVVLTTATVGMNSD